MYRVLSKWVGKVRRDYDMSKILDQPKKKRPYLNWSYFHHECLKELERFININVTNTSLL